MISRKLKRWQSRYVDGNEIRLLHSGEEFFSALERNIQEAKSHIHIQVYTLEPDETGMRIISLLKEAAMRGVRVYAIFDAFGSQNLAESHLQDMRNSGIIVRKFSPLFSGIRIKLGRKMHHKIFVADGEIALTGGLNISNSYSGRGETPWLDFGVQVRGPICGELEKTCRMRWKREFRRNKFPLALPTTSGTSRVRASRNDWFRNRTQISATYADMVKLAKKEIFILSPYFLPGYRFLRSLLHARKGGVRIILVLPGLSDVPLVKYATEHLYATLLPKGIDIYEWKDSVLHGKIAIMDSAWCTIGSYNPNALSDYLSLEMNIDIDDGAFSSQFREELEKTIITKCTKITVDEYARSSTLMKKIVNGLAYHATWLLLRLQFVLTTRK